MEDPRGFNSEKIRAFMKKVSFGPHPDFDRVLLDGKGTLSRVEVRAQARLILKKRHDARATLFPNMPG